MSSDSINQWGLGTSRRLMPFTFLQVYGILFFEFCPSYLTCPKCSFPIPTLGIFAGCIWIYYSIECFGIVIQAISLPNNLSHAFSFHYYLRLYRATKVAGNDKAHKMTISSKWPHAQNDTNKSTRLWPWAISLGCKKWPPKWSFHMTKTSFWLKAQVSIGHHTPRSVTLLTSESELSSTTSILTVSSTNRVSLPLKSNESIRINKL